MRLSNRIVLYFLVLANLSTCKTSSDITDSKNTNKSQDKMTADFQKSLQTINPTAFTKRARLIEARDLMARQSFGKDDHATNFLTSKYGAMIRERPVGSDLKLDETSAAAQQQKLTIKVKDWQLNPSVLDWPQQKYTNDIKDVLAGTIKGPAGAKRLSLAFDSIEVEAYFDQIRLIDGSGKVCDIISGSYPDGFVSGFCDGNSIEIRVSTDSKVSGYEGSGFKLAGFYVDGADALSLNSSGTNNYPVAIAQADTYRTIEGNKVNFSGSESFDPDDDRLSYRWSFGDGQTSTSQNPTHQYNSSGTYSVRLDVRDSRGALAQDQIVIIIEKLVPPDNFGFESVTARSVLLSWNSKKYVKGYHLNVVESNVGKPTCRGTDVDGETRYRVKGLKPETKYIAAICAYTDEKISDSNIARFQTTAIEYPPAPTNLSVTNLRSKNFKLQWTSGAANTTEFKVSIAKGVTASSCTNGTIVGTATSYQFNNLSPGETYTVLVCAANFDGDTTVSSPKTLTMGPPEPVGLIARGVSPSAVEVSWTSGGMNTSSFIVSYSKGTPLPGVTCTGGVNVGNVSSYNLGALEDDTYYSVRVCAVGNNVTTDGITASARTWVLEPSTKPPRDTQTNLPIVGTSVDNYRYIIAVGTDGKSYYNSFNLSVPSSRWMGWVALPNQSKWTNKPLSFTSVGNVLTVKGYVNELNDYYAITGTCVSGRCTWSGWARVSDSDAPQPTEPSQLTVGTSNATNVTLNWAKAESNSGNIGYMATTVAGTTSPSTCIGGTKLGDVSSTVVSGLVSGATYSARLCSLNARGASSSGLAITFKTADAPRPPEVSQLAITTRSSSTAKLTWVSGGGSTVGYIVARATGSTAPANCLGGTRIGKTATYSFTDLKPSAKYSFRVCAVAGNSAHSIGVTKDIQTQASVIKINSAGGASSDFVADTKFSGGATYGVASAIDLTGVVKPGPVSVYQTVRFGNFYYAIGNLESSRTYLIRLHFSEIYSGKSNERIFDVSINGTKVLINFDVFSESGGKFKALVREFNAKPDAAGKIQISFKTLKLSAILSGLEVQVIPAAN